VGRPLPHHTHSLDPGNRVAHVTLSPQLTRPPELCLAVSVAFSASLSLGHCCTLDVTPSLLRLTLLYCLAYDLSVLALILKTSHLIQPYTKYRDHGSSSTHRLHAHNHRPRPNLPGLAKWHVPTQDIPRRRDAKSPHRHGDACDKRCTRRTRQHARGPRGPAAENYGGREY
jgi:hypothetical protein